MAEIGEPHHLGEEEFQNIHTMPGDMLIEGSLLNDLLDQNTKLENQVSNLEDRIQKLEARALDPTPEQESKIHELEEKVKNLQTQAETMDVSNKGKWDNNSRNREEHDSKVNSLESNKNLKRKWNEGQLKQKENQLKKNKATKCATCGENHLNVCLKGKGVCYKCGQKGHVISHCPKLRKNQGCFKCGDESHHVKKCPKEEISEDHR